MARRKYVLHEYATDRGKTGGNSVNSRSKPKDKSLTARAKVRQVLLFIFVFLFCRISNIPMRID